MSRPADVNKHISLAKLVELLDFVKDGIAVNGLTVEVLSSQAATYGLSLPAMSIKGMALNTAKRIAEERFSGGFDSVDESRKQALEALVRKRAPTPKLSRRARLEERVKQLENQVEILSGDLTHLSGAFEFALDCMRKYAAHIDDPIVRNDYRTDEQELFARASVVVQPVIKGAPVFQLIVGKRDD
jgi:hypothetical protein